MRFLVLDRLRPISVFKMKNSSFIMARAISNVIHAIPRIAITMIVTMTKTLTSIPIMVAGFLKSLIIAFLLLIISFSLLSLSLCFLLYCKNSETNGLISSMIFIFFVVCCDFINIFLILTYLIYILYYNCQSYLCIFFVKEKPNII